MPVTAEQIEIAESQGMQNVALIAQCCNETGARFYIALAMLETERGRHGYVVVVHRENHSGRGRTVLCDRMLRYEIDRIWVRLRHVCPRSLPCADDRESVPAFESDLVTLDGVPASFLPTIDDWPYRNASCPRRMA